MARVLIIDDDLMVSQLLREHLSNEGYDVDAAFQAEEGFEKALKTPPDLILLDVNLPDATGFQMCGRFKEHALTTSIPIIMITGAARWPNQQAIGKQLGANEYILKPFDVIQLVDRIHSLMGAKRPARVKPTTVEPPAMEPAEPPQEEQQAPPEPPVALSFVSPASVVVEASVEEQRYLDFSVEVLILVSRLPKTRAGRHLADQLLRCGTAVGARIQEGSLRAALKEIREAGYWLMLARRGGLLETPSLGELEKKCQELTGLLANVVTAEKQTT